MERRCHFCDVRGDLTWWKTATQVRLACVDRVACAARCRARAAAEMNRAATS